VKKKVEKRKKKKRSFPAGYIFEKAKKEIEKGMKRKDCIEGKKLRHTSMQEEKQTKTFLPHILHAGDKANTTLGLILSPKDFSPPCVSLRISRLSRLEFLPHSREGAYVWGSSQVGTCSVRKE